MSAFYWKQVSPITIPNSQLKLTGYSWAAKNTSFYIPELKIMLDCGVENDYIPNHIFISHCHADHSKNIPLNIIQLNNSKCKEKRKINYYVPEVMVDCVINYIDSFFIMSKNNPNHKAHQTYNIIGVKDNSRIELLIRNKKFIVEVVKCFHTVPCVGYGFIEVRQRLKDEFKNLQREQIIELKKSGVEIQKEVEIPLFCYLGDSNERVFSNDLLKKYSVIMSECTFLYPDQINDAKHKKHIHFDNLKNIIEANMDKTFILYHFSDRFEKEEIVNFFNQKHYNNVILWV
jgi:ribonuclease Z